MSTETDAADPIERAWLGEDNSECPECEHERGEPYENPWRPLLNLLRIPRRPRAADCEWRVEAQAEVCGCEHPFHGS